MMLVYAGYVIYDAERVHQLHKRYSYFVSQRCEFRRKSPCEHFVPAVLGSVTVWCWCVLRKVFFIAVTSYRYHIHTYMDDRTDYVRKCAGGWGHKTFDRSLRVGTLTLIRSLWRLQWHVYDARQALTTLSSSSTNSSTLLLLLLLLSHVHFAAMPQLPCHTF